MALKLRTTEPQQNVTGSYKKKRVSDQHDLKYNFRSDEEKKLLSLPIFYAVFQRKFGLFLLNLL